MRSHQEMGDTETIQIICFTSVSLALLVLLFTTIGYSCKHEEDENDKEKRERVRNLRIRYVLVYATATFADWSQGAYFYDVYDEYGFSRSTIQAFFVIGFLSSALFGTVVASLADRFGRKWSVQLYFIVYAVNCLCIHNRALWSILLGRVLGGIATSLLFSSFDSWFVCSHENLEGYVSQSFSIASTANAASAILAGLVSQVLVDKIPLHLGRKVQTISVSYGSSLAIRIVLFNVIDRIRSRFGSVGTRTLQPTNNNNNNNNDNQKTCPIGTYRGNTYRIRRYEYFSHRIDGIYI